MSTIKDYIREKVEKFNSNAKINAIRQQFQDMDDVVFTATIMTIDIALLSIFSAKHGRAIKKLRKELKQIQNIKGE